MPYLATLALTSAAHFARAAPQAGSAAATATGAISSIIAGGASSVSSASGAVATSSGSQASGSSAGSATATASGSASSSTATGTSSSGGSCTGNVTYIESSGPNASGDISFGENYAVMFLDYVAGIVQGVQDTCDGQAFLNASQTWSQAVHNVTTNKPLIMYSRLYFQSDSRYEVADNLDYGFSQVAGSTNFTLGSDPSTIVPEVQPQQGDFVFQKVRYSAVDFNDALITLRSQNISTVVLSGIRVTGVIMASMYPLFDQNFQVYVISNNTAEPGNNTESIKQAILGPNGAVAKLPANVISLEQALTAIGSSTSSS